MIHEPLTGAALRMALRAILDRPVAELPQVEGLRANDTSYRPQPFEAATRLYPKAPPKFDHMAMIADVKAGMTSREAAAKYKVDPNTINEWRRKHGCSAPQSPATRAAAQRRRDYDEAAIVADLRDGMTNLAAAEKHGISDSTVSVIRIKHNVVKPVMYDREQAVADLKSGMTAAAVAAKHGTAASTMRSLRRRVEGLE